MGSKSLAIIHAFEHASHFFGILLCVKRDQLGLHRAALVFYLQTPHPIPECGLSHGSSNLPSPQWRALQKYFPHIPASQDLANCLHGQYEHEKGSPHLYFAGNSENSNYAHTYPLACPDTAAIQQQLCPLTSIKCWLPVTVWAAPWKLIRISASEQS
jgi:hypothetical protein